MPIEIKELIIKVNIQEKNIQTKELQNIDKNVLAKLKEEVLNECMEKIDAYFERLTER